ncbi:MAG: heme lyase CcmF/NrfE family subunit [Gammaproteobacteria bacterium]
MFVELGHFALILALFVAIVMAVLPTVGAARGNLRWMAVARPAGRMLFALVALSFAALTWAFATNDFSLVYVANNSNSDLPLQYRITAVWGAHEGSMLLWMMVFSAWTLAVTIFSKQLPEAFVARVLGVMGMISTGFLLFILLTSNPFIRQFPVPANGADLNPLLQDPGMISHPPMLYMGYVGFSVAFGFAIAALLGGRLDVVWARWSRPWTIAAWSFLTIGITLGSYWSYYELGWGGWWFWDPVENASFMPWLVGTALIHSLSATEKRGVFKNWTVLLSICAFALSLLGTFLVRSGVLTSVHAFANDPARGVFILIFLGVVIGGSLMLYAWRAPGLAPSNRYDLVSRETFLLINSVLLTVAMTAVLLGTVYPLVVEALGMDKLSVGPPYFNAVFIPLMVPVALAVGIGALCRWRSDDWRRLWRQLRFAFIGSIVLGVALVAMLAHSDYFMTALGVSLAIWIVSGTVVAVRERLRHRGGLWRGLKSLPSGFLGMSLAHIGFAVTIVGVTITSQFSVEQHKRMGPGESTTFAGYTFHMDRLHDITGPNYTGTEAVVSVTDKDGDAVTTLRTQKRKYNVRDTTTTEAGIHAGVFRDLYASLGAPLGNGDWSIRLYYRPFVRWIWFGALFMMLGGIMAARDKRYRVRARETAAMEEGQTGQAARP